MTTFSSRHDFEVTVSKFLNLFYLCSFFFPGINSAAFFCGRVSMVSEKSHQGDESNRWYADGVRVDTFPRSRALGLHEEMQKN